MRSTSDVKLRHMVSAGSSLVISTHPPAHEWMWIGDTTTPWLPSPPPPTLLEQWCGFFNFAREMCDCENKAIWNGTAHEVAGWRSLEGGCHAIVAPLKQAKTVSLHQWKPRNNGFCYQRLHCCIETIRCRLLLPMARMKMDCNLEKKYPPFSSFQAASRENRKIILIFLLSLLNCIWYLRNPAVTFVYE